MAYGNTRCSVINIGLTSKNCKKEVLKIDIKKNKNLLKYFVKMPPIMISFLWKV